MKKSYEPYSDARKARSTVLSVNSLSLGVILSSTSELTDKTATLAMAVLVRSCCCGCSLKTGVLVLAFFSLVSKFNCARFFEISFHYFLFSSSAK